MSIPPYRCRFGTYSIAGPRDAADIGVLLRKTPMHGSTRMLYTREPDFFADTNPLGGNAAIIARSPGGDAMLLYELREYPVYVAGKATRAVYLGLLRVAEAYRRNIGLLEHGFLALRGFARKLGFADSYFTSIALDNTPARRLLEAGLARLPRYMAQGDMETLLFSTRLGRSNEPLPKHYELGQAKPADADELENLMAANSRVWNYACAPGPGQLTSLLSSGRAFSFSDITVLRHKGLAVGMIGVWDQRPYRQLLISGYSSGMEACRPFYNLWASFKKLPLLPPPGNRLSLVFLPFFHLQGGHSALADFLLRRALHKAAGKGAALCALGLSPQNPLRRRIALPVHTYRTRIYRVQFPGALLAGSDVTIATQPEIALL